MQHAALVGKLDCPRDLQKKRRSLAIVDGRGTLRETSALGELHHEERHTLERTNLVHRHHVWMVQPGDGFRLLPETPQFIRPRKIRGSQHL